MTIHQPESTAIAGRERNQESIGWRSGRLVGLTRIAFLWAILCSAVAAPPAASNELGAFDAAAAAAYYPYREAAFYLRTGNVGAGAIALEQAIAGWRSVQAAYRDNPPDAYAEDPQWSADLDSIVVHLETGLAEADNGDGTAAAKTLAAVRSTLGALRQRNGQWRFSDCVDAMNAQMDELWRYRHAPPDLGSVEAVDQVKAQAAVTLHWYRRCRAQAPDELRDDTEFNRLFDGSIASLSLIPSALNEANEMRFINILREMRSFDRMIWLRFG